MFVGRSSFLLLLLLSTLCCLTLSQSAAPPINLFVYTAVSPDGNINGYLISDNNNCVIVDSGVNSSQALTLVRLVNRNCQEQPLLIFITHGQQDAYGGVPALHQQYPFTPIQVANVDVKNDLLANVATLNASGTLNADAISFDWNSTVGILKTPGKISGLVDPLYVDTNFPEAETPAYGVVYYNNTPFLLTGDLVFVDNHAYLGASVNYTRLVDWRARALSSLGRRYGTKDLVLYPTYGPSSDFDAISDQQLYLQNFQVLLLTCPNDINFFTPQQLAQEMIKIYPQYSGRPLLNYMVQNPAWTAAQRQYGCQIGLMATPQTPNQPMSDAARPTAIGGALLLALLLALFC